MSFVYDHDYLNRRVRKTSMFYMGDDWWKESSDHLFVYDGWNVVAVLDANADNAVVRKYTWGLDLSGLSGDASPSGVRGAGGIGGLLASVEAGGELAGTYWFLYDANGNVGQVLDATDPGNITTAAKYEYDPYGNTTSSAAPGTYAAHNPFRFSSKWYDAEIKAYYYGYRYYLPYRGRWASRDPIEEEGGVSLYCFVQNKPITGYDILGLSGYGAAGRAEIRSRRKEA